MAEDMPLRLPDRAETLSFLIAVAALLFAAALPAAEAAAEAEPVRGGEPAVQAPPDAAFDAWKETLRREALGLGISKETLDKALTPAAPIAKVIELDRKQPEFTQTFWRYVDLRVNETRIARGQEMLKVHAALLSVDPYTKDQSEMVMILNIATLFSSGLTWVVATYILQEELNKLAKC